MSKVWFSRVPRSILWALLAAVVGCGSPPPPVTMESLYRQERELPQVFLTVKSNKRIVAPGDQRVFVDKATGELAWPALACENPQCPGRSSAGEPFLFVAPDPTIVAKPDGTIGVDPALDTKPNLLLGFCPKCLEIRHREAETDEDRTRYARYVKPYVLPETQKRREELAQARQKRKAELEERMKRPLEK
jgi:hypothetical protein